MKKILSLGLGAGLLLTQAGVVFAQSDIIIKQPTGWVYITQLGQLVSALTGLAILISAILCFLYLVWGGIEWIASGGDKAAMESARNRITAAFVGLTIVLVAWAIMKMLETFFGITVLGGSVLKIPSVIDFPTQ